MKSKICLTIFLTVPIVALWAQPVLVRMPSRVESDPDPDIQAQIEQSNIDSALEFVYSIAGFLAVDPRTADTYRLRRISHLVFLDLYKRRNGPDSIPQDMPRLVGEEPGRAKPPYLSVLLVRNPPEIKCYRDPKLPESVKVTAHEALQTTLACLEEAVPSALPLHRRTRMWQSGKGWGFDIRFQYKGVQFYLPPIHLRVSLDDNKILAIRPWVPPAKEDCPQDMEARLTENEATAIAVRQYEMFLKGHMWRKVSVAPFPMNTQAESLLIVTPKPWPLINPEVNSPYPEFPAKSKTEPRLCWRIPVHTLDKHNRFIYVFVDAINGELLKVQVTAASAEQVEGSIEKSAKTSIYIKDVTPSTGFLAE